MEYISFRKHITLSHSVFTHCKILTWYHRASFNRCQSSWIIGKICSLPLILNSPSFSSNFNPCTDTNYLLSPHSIPVTQQEQLLAMATTNELFDPAIWGDELQLSNSILACFVGFHHSYQVWDEIHSHFHALVLAKSTQFHLEIWMMKNGASSTSEFFCIKPLVDSLFAIRNPVFYLVATILRLVLEASMTNTFHYDCYWSCRASQWGKSSDFLF